MAVIFMNEQPVIVCPNCGHRGFLAVSDRGAKKKICVACDAREGGHPIHLPDAEDLSPSTEPRAMMVRVIHLTSVMEGWDQKKYASELARMLG